MQAPRTDEDLRLRLLPEDRERLKIMLLAKHAKNDTGAPDPVDGTHAVYHHELRMVLGELVPNLFVGNSYEDLFEDREYDFLFTLLNRGGFKNSEILAPTMAVWRQRAHLGASPILRGVGDDKHLMKLCARARGVHTPESVIYRRGSGYLPEPDFDWDRIVVKPNASSASWGVEILDNWADAEAHREWLFGEAGGFHDVVVEKYYEGIELAVPVIPGRDGKPAYLPVMKYTSDDNDRLRTYEEKRGLKPTTEGFRPFHEQALCDLVVGEVEKMMPEIWPFDYGRFEFKVDPETMTSAFLELNMSCNLWSKKTLSLSWQSLSWSHAELVETILAGSMLRQGVIERVA
ncbi:MAG: phosphoribosylglycinamide synthetase [Pseudomonadota bacterium]